MRGAAWRRGPLTLLCAILCLAGAAQIGAGLYIPAKAALAQVLLERAFDRSLATRLPQKPWAWADMTPAARITVPRLGVARVVLDSGSGQAMAFGPTLLPGGAAIGERGTAVIAAHRDTHFRFLRDVRRGDIITVQTRKGLTRRYAVTGSGVVRWNGYALANAASGEKLDLVTCFPFDAVTRGPWRYVVHAAALD
ncbi:sortase [Novosphingobium sp. Leaf2]|nr:sortase [Novosphingobium sp. Leaf2]